MYTNKFATQRAMDGGAMLNIWGPANVETVYQAIRNCAAIEEQKNCQWVHTNLHGTLQQITSTATICGWVRRHDVQSLTLYGIYYSAGAWSGYVNFTFTGLGNLIYSVQVDLAGAGYVLVAARLDHPGGPPYGGRVMVQSSTAGLYLAHLGIYQDEVVTPPDVYPDQVRRSRADLFAQIANRINGLANREVHVGGWLRSQGYTVAASAKPATAQIRLYHGLQYVDSKDMTNYKRTYDCDLYAVAHPSSGNLNYVHESGQSGDSYDDILRINHGGGQLDGGSWATANPRSEVRTYLWKEVAEATSLIDSVGFWARKKAYAGRPDTVDAIANFAADEVILQSDWEAIWKAAHYGHLYGCARPVLSWCPPGRSALAIGTGYAFFLLCAIPTGSWTEPWGCGWTTGKIPLRFWWSALNRSASARTITIRYTWGGVSLEKTWDLAGSGSGQQYTEHSVELAPPSPNAPLLIEMKINTATTVTFSSGWGAISFPLDY